MTVKELYEWAMEHNAENYDLMIQFRDDGGYYVGYEDAHDPCIDRDTRYSTDKHAVFI